MQRRKWKSTGWDLRVNGSKSKRYVEELVIDCSSLVLLSCVSRDVKGVREDQLRYLSAGNLINALGRGAIGQRKLGAVRKTTIACDLYGSPHLYSWFNS